MTCRRCHAWVPNVIRPLSLVSVATSLSHLNLPLTISRFQNEVFGQLTSIPEEQARHMTPPPTRLLGRYFDQGFGVSVIPASFVLLCLNLYLLHRAFRRLS
mmetsp:Transcript_22100/g.52518  ORF Transcript_22100/g.52518 Transcript_22100/m.52518 type:complete len:101 (+) Transcript_22100:50-352(+)